MEYGKIYMPLLVGTTHMNFIIIYEMRSDIIGVSAVVSTLKKL